MNTKTQKYIDDSHYVVSGFTEEFFDDMGKLLGSKRLQEIPEDREVGSEGEIRFTLAETRAFTITTFGKTKVTTRYKGSYITSRIDAICGRLKFNHDR